MKRFTFILFVHIMFCAQLHAQDSLSIENYKRAVSFMHENLKEKVFNTHVEPVWFPDSSGLWFIHNSPEIKKYHKITFPENTINDLFNHEKLASILSDSLKEEVNANKLPIHRIKVNSESEMLISAKGKQFLLNTNDYSLNAPPAKEKRNYTVELSPDKSWTAYSEDFNLFIKWNENGAIKQLSTDGQKNYEYASWYGWYDIMEGENGKRPQRFGVDWSEDSKWIATNICDLRLAEKMYLLDWSIDTLYRPKLLSYYRGSPGDSTMVYMHPVFFNVETGKKIKPPLPKATHINAINFSWSETPGIVYLEQMTRGYQNVSLYAFNLDTEKLDTLYSETSLTNLDNFTTRLAEESKLVFILSEKSGWNQLYSIDLETKKEKKISNGNYVINSIAHIDEENQKVFFLASGKEEMRNPYYQHLYSISFDGSGLQLLSPENCHHRISISPDGKYFVDNYSRVNQATTTVLRDAHTGALLSQMSTAQIHNLKNWKAPEIFQTLAHDQKTNIYGAIWKPTDFDSTKHYPVIELSYTGPHTQVFPKDFTRAFSLQSYAELGFIAVMVDGLGSSGRSKAFHNHSYKNLGGNLKDHILAIKELGKRHTWIDTTRVGIFGHSAGGYDAGRAVLAYPDFYKVAVASSADHDHRMEKAWWPEMYMGWPVDSAYHLQSNITNAGNLKGKLLLTHGGIDENVNPSATFKLAEALIKADKQFDMLILPSQRHGYTGKHQKYFTKTRWNYFVKHLKGVEPIWDFEWK